MTRAKILKKRKLKENSPEMKKIKTEVQSYLFLLTILGHKGPLFFGQPRLGTSLVAR